MNIFSELVEKLNFLHFRPVRIDDVEICPIQERGYTRYVLKNPAKKTYLKITALEHFLWERMDGSQTVRELYAAYYEKYNVLPGTRVAQFILRLRDKWFLKGSETPVFVTLRAVLAAQSLSARAMRFFVRSFRFTQVDRPTEWLYRRGGHLAFTRPGAIALAVLSVVGLVCFGIAWAGGSFPVWRLGGSTALAVLYYVLLFSVVTAIHEVAHALAVKHYGREVIGMGVTTYGYLVLSPFVDTTDMHAQPSRQAKVTVSLAGPATHLIVGGLAGVGSVLLPWDGAKHLAFMLGLFSYGFLFLFALYPGSGSDWFNIVSDYWQIPNLALHVKRFVRNELWMKLRSKQELSGTERVVVSYWATFVAWRIAFAVALSYLIYLHRWLPAYLWREGGWLGRGLVVALTTSTVLATSFLLFLLSRYLLIQLQRSKLLATSDRILRSSYYLLTGLLVAPPLIALLADRGQVTLILPALLVAVVAPATFAVCVASLRTWSSHPWQRTQAFLGCVALLVLVGALVLAWPAAPEGLRGILFAAFVAVTALAIFAASCMAYCLNGFEICTRREQLSLVVATAAAVALLIPALTCWGAEHEVSRLATMVSSSATALIFFALCMFAPTALTFGKTASASAWACAIGATLTLALAFAAGPLLAPLDRYASDLTQLLLLGNCVNLLALASLAHRLASRRARFGRPEPARDVLRTDGEHLRSAANILLTHVMDNVDALFGGRRAETLKNEYNRECLQRDIDLTFGPKGLDDEVPAEADIREIVHTHGTALGLLLQLVARFAGAQFTRDMFSYLFGFLNWREREVFSSQVMTGAYWAEFAEPSKERLPLTPQQLLRSVPFFDRLSQEQILHLQSLFRLEDCPAGEVLFNQGDPGDALYIVLDGKVEIVVTTEDGRDEVVATCAPVNYFGEIALLEDVPRTAGARTATPTRLAILSGEDFKRHVVPHVPTGSHGVWNVARLLQQLPVFQSFDWPALADVADKFTLESVSAGEVIIRQGDVGDKFYVLESGNVEVSVAETQDDGTTRATVLNRLGPGECFGEIALLYDVPRTATVTALSACGLFVLPREAFEQLHADAFGFESSARQIASRRLADIALATGARGLDLGLDDEGDD